MQAMFVGADTVAVCSGDDGEGRVILKAVGGGWFDMVDACGESSQELRDWSMRMRE